MKCINPATEEVIDRVTCDDRRSVHNKFRRLKEGYKRWRGRSYEERFGALVRMMDELQKRESELAQILVREVGTPIVEAQREVSYVRQRVEQVFAAAQEAVGQEVVAMGGASGATVRRVPLGVVAHLSSWHRPLATGVEMMVPALLVGNTVLYKPSEHTPLTAMMLVDLLRRAGLGEEVVALVLGDGSMGDFVLDEPVDAVAYSGSASTGRMVAEKLARRMIPRHIEVGITQGVYVCEDVDVKGVADGVAERAFRGGGPGCRGVDRIYVHEAVARPFTDALCQRVSTFDVGDPARATTTVGPVVCARRIGQLEYQIGDAVQKGARLLLGGRARGGRGYFFAPTVLVDVDHRMLVMREKTPGPVICVQRVCDDAEAVHRLRDVDHGLRAGMICGDRTRAEQVLRSLDARGVYWWSGERGNGEGERDLAGVMAGSPHDAVRRFTRPQPWCVG